MSDDPPADVGGGRGAADVTDLVSGGLSVVLGCAVLVAIRDFPELPDGQPGPALFPGIISGLLIVLGMTLVVRWFLRRRTTVPSGTPSDASATAAKPTTGARVNAVAVVGAVVVYILVVESLGFILTTTGLLVVLMWRFGARPLVAVAASVATTFVLVALFNRLLLVPLPPGILG